MNKLLVALGTSVLSPVLLAKPIIVTSIKPVSMVVAAVAGDHAKIEQIVSSTASPHDFALRPSDLAKISQADTVVWVGESLERFLEKPLENAGKEDSAIEWLALTGMTLQNFDEGHHDDHADHDEHHDDHADHDEHHDEHADHDEHHDDHADHDEHHDDHADHDEHHDDHADHDEHHDDHADHNEQASGHEGHHHEGVNPHVWLYPENAKVLAEAVAKRLSKIDPENAASYQANLADFEKGLALKDAELKASLATVKDVPYIVFHDGYGYFEDHYGLDHVGEVTVSPERKPGAKKIAEIREMINHNKVQCVFSEPQFSPAIVRTLLDGTDVNSVPLDPLGTDIAMNRGAYLAFLSEIGGQFMSCLR
ncbi:zinc ABC transporter substrate-binding protein ZnuA [Marinomonas pollencensis]|uniref:High-affinity zinc uptake system protein ZnuA n=1 Tax=Marinomonas pollencensis TaxID=491954 RepID=A0A3E0DMZ5_9GAMM|nr:zinc ABC transporter substrate-binding protein ZnuA [Marinomonas pollencensis]REG82877.1 zinc transport system substrate-binding protein [Marinomonas pollencensis]